jgi:hypothetical protein
LSGTAIGTDRICAPTVSWSFHPNPFTVPYVAVKAAGLPILRTVGQVGRIERRLAIGVAGKRRLDVLEIRLCRVCRHGLRNEFSVTLHGQQWPQFLLGVFADGVCRRHHDAGVLQHLLARIVDEDAVEHDGSNHKSDGRGRQNHEIELGSEPHCLGSVGSMVPGLEIV